MSEVVKSCVVISPISDLPGKPVVHVGLRLEPGLTDQPGCFAIHAKPRPAEVEGEPSRLLPLQARAYSHLPCNCVEELHAWADGDIDIRQRIGWIGYRVFERVALAENTSRGHQVESETT